MNRFGKHSKKLLQQQKSKHDRQNQLQKEPETADELFMAGSNEEESGDRWLTSDLSKALRFYQRAYNYYSKALNLQSTHLDTRYNISRLLFNVYNHYIKNEGVYLNELVNCPDSLTGDEGAVIQPLVNIVKFFQASCDSTKNENQLPWDLYYNSSLCYFEYIEELTKESDGLSSNYNDIMSCLDLTKSLLEQVLNYQVNDLNNIITKGSLMDSDNNSADSSNYLRQMGAEIEENTSYASSQETILPSTICETCLNCYRLLTVLNESCVNIEQHKAIQNNLDDFLTSVDGIVDNLVTSFSSSPTELVPSLTEDELSELHLAKVALLASSCLDFDALKNTWESVPLDNSLDKLFLETSSYRTLLDKIDFSLISLGDLTRWNVLSFMAKQYRQAHEMVKAEYDSLKSQRVDSTDRKSIVITQLCSVLIERADIDLERSELQNEAALKSTNVLKTNYKNLLKNCLVFSQQSGGLRESSSDKLLRRKKQKEALIRLCLVEDKTSLEELNTIVGIDYWPQELKDVSDLGIYSKFNVKALGNTP